MPRYSSVQSSASTTAPGCPPPSTPSPPNWASAPLLYRYSGVDREEETFIACAYWRVHALICVGRHDEARDLFARLHGVANPLGLMSEMCVAADGELVGNLPQALSHLTFIRAAGALRSAETREPR